MIVWIEEVKYMGMSAIESVWIIASQYTMHVDEMIPNERCRHNKNGVGWMSHQKNEYEAPGIYQYV